MTALEFIKNRHPINTEGSYVLRNVEELMIDFAKAQAKIQLEAILKKAKIINDPYSYTGNTGSEYPIDQIISEESIINAYPLTNIK